MMSRTQGVDLPLQEKPEFCRLFEAMRVPQVEANQRYLKWYAHFLARQVTELPEHLLSLFVDHGHATAKTASQESVESLKPNRLEVVLEVMIVAINSLRSGAPLSTILCQLGDLRLLDAHSKQSSLAAQNLFILLGYSTFLFQPDTNPEKGYFQVQCSNSAEPQGTWLSRRVCIQDDIMDQRLDKVLKHLSYYGGPVPTSASHARASVVIASSNINYYTLQRLSGVSIIWCDSICEHLEFDIASLKLKLFRFPSFCALMAAMEARKGVTTHQAYSVASSTKPDKSEHFLNRFFVDYAKHTSEPHATTAIYKELLETYRLLFGQYRRAWSAFKKNELYKDLVRDKVPVTDPLLADLCGGDWTKQTVFHTVRSKPAKVAYISHADFPCFGERLLELQDFALTQSPTGIMTLWQDRRDVARFYTLWAAIAFGVVTIILTVVQVILAIAQVVSGFK